jgi:hypothetical protein
MKPRATRLAAAGLATTAALLFACSTTPSQQEQALQDFIDVEPLEERDKIQTSSRDKRDVLTKDYLIYEGRKEVYLIKFRSPCYSLLEDRVEPDTRRSSKAISINFETINGCHIGKAYALTEAQAAEIKEIVTSTDGRN